jgi:tetratricopeptide (TPR) repeat protein
MNWADRRPQVQEPKQPGYAGQATDTALRLRDAAIAAHRANRLDEAIPLFRRYLVLAPTDALGHHALGVALRDKGDAPGAIEALRHAVALMPQDMVARQNLGALYYSSNRFEEAREAFEAVLSVQQDWPLAWRNLGAALVALGRSEEAHRVLAQAVRLAPQDAWAHYHLASAAMAMGDNQTAITALEEALSLMPETLEFAAALGGLFERTGDFGRADLAYRHAMMMRPDEISTILPVARRLTLAGKADEALILLDYADSLQPENPATKIGYAWAWRVLGDPDRAAAICRDILNLVPEMIDAHFLLATLEMEAGNDAAACAGIARVIAQDPGHVDARMNDAYLSLAAGDLSAGWGKFEARLELPIFRHFHHQGPRWQGEPLDGRTILIEAEQGAGDCLQFVRYVPLVAARAARVLLRVPSTVAGLLTHLAENVVLVPWESKVTEFDCRIEMMSLPLRFGTTLETIPAAVPYLTVEESLVAAWRARLDTPDPVLRVGIVWAGNPDHLNDCNRSMPVRYLQPLTAIPGVRWYSLQVGPRAGELAELSPDSITDLSSDLATFSDTAAALSALDLLIAVDTSIVHLAGGLGLPVWVLLATASEWRWLRERADSPWYPSLRIFRQQRYRDWEEVITRVGEALVRADFRSLRRERIGR